MRWILVVAIVASLSAGCARNRPPATVEYDFFGRVVDAHLPDDYRVGPRPMVWSPGHAGGTAEGDEPLFRVGPARLTLASGRRLHVPPSTPGGNACELLYDVGSIDIRDGEDVDTWKQMSGVAKPRECVIIGEADGERVEWFQILVDYQPESRTVAVDGIAELTDDGALTWDGYVFPMASEVTVHCLGDEDSFEEVVRERPHAAYVDVDTGRVVEVECIATS